VITNLLSNAIKFSPKGSLVEVVVKHVRGNVKVSVVDQGPGISIREQKRIFEKFYQVRGSDGSGDRGAGLGLAISKGIIDRHGGAIVVKSAVGEGSTFSFLLPVPGEDALQSDE
jgi:signal transduction histidine kinase